MSQMVEIKGISKSFGKTIALSEIDLTIEEGQFLPWWDRPAAARLPC